MQSTELGSWISWISEKTAGHEFVAIAEGYSERMPLSLS